MTKIAVHKDGIAIVVERENLVLDTEKMLGIVNFSQRYILRILPLPDGGELFEVTNPSNGKVKKGQGFVFTNAVDHTRQGFLGSGDEVIMINQVPAPLARLLDEKAQLLETKQCKVLSSKS